MTTKRWEDSELTVEELTSFKLWEKRRFNLYLSGGQTMLGSACPNPECWRPIALGGNPRPGNCQCLDIEAAYVTPRRVREIFQLDGGDWITGGVDGGRVGAALKHIKR